MPVVEVDLQSESGLNVVHSASMASLDDLSKSLGQFEKAHNNLEKKVANIEGQLSAPRKPPHPWFVPLLTSQERLFFYSGDGYPLPLYSTETDSREFGRPC
jgi:hypothetical protein